MKDIDYHEFYKNCIHNNEVTIKKYLPVGNLITEVLFHYYNEGVFDRGCYTDNNINIEELYFIKDLLRLFSRIMKDKKYNYLNEYIDFLLNINIYYEDFVDYLELFVYKKVNGFDNSYYYYFFSKLLYSVRKNINYAKNIDGESRVINIIKSYVNYYKDPNEKDITSLEKDARDFYVAYAHKFIMRFYFSDDEIDNLNALLDSLFYNYDDIRTYLNENNPHDDNFIRFNLFEGMLNNFNKAKKLIK